MGEDSSARSISWSQLPTQLPANKQMIDLRNRLFLYLEEFTGLIYDSARSRADRSGISRRGRGCERSSTIVNEETARLQAIIKPDFHSVVNESTSDYCIGCNPVVVCRKPSKDRLTDELARETAYRL